MEDKFVMEARAEGFLGLGGHVHRGGLRATMYNPFEYSSAEALVHFIHKFD